MSHGGGDAWPTLLGRLPPAPRAKAVEFGFRGYNGSEAQQILFKETFGKYAHNEGNIRAKNPANSCRQKGRCAGCGLVRNIDRRTHIGPECHGLLVILASIYDLYCGTGQPANMQQRSDELFRQLEEWYWKMARGHGRTTEEDRAGGIDLQPEEMSDDDEEASPEDNEFIAPDDSDDSDSYLGSDSEGEWQGDDESSDDDDDDDDDEDDNPRPRQRRRVQEVVEISDDSDDDEPQRPRRRRHLMQRRANGDLARVAQVIDDSEDDSDDDDNHRNPFRGTSRRPASSRRVL